MDIDGHTEVPDSPYGIFRGSRLACHRPSSLVTAPPRYSPPASEMNIQSVESSCPIRQHEM